VTPAAVAAIHADGGVLGLNPSKEGGVYAWRHLDSSGRVLRQDSGLALMPGEPTTVAMLSDLPFVQVPAWHTNGQPVACVSNNMTEFLAVLCALEALPDGWSGDVCSDSGVTLGRLCGSYSLRNIPRLWVERGARVRQRLGRLTPVLHQGHPTKADLAAGYGAKRGHRVSEHNVWADAECNRLKTLYRTYAPPRPRVVHATVAVPAAVSLGGR
jgi:hypothetical protein